MNYIGDDFNKVEGVDAYVGKTDKVTITLRKDYRPGIDGPTLDEIREKIKGGLSRFLSSDAEIEILQN